MFKIIIKKLENLEDNSKIRLLILNTSKKLINNKTFQLYYTHNLTVYFNLLSTLLRYANDDDTVKFVLENDFLLNIGYLSKESYNCLVNFIINDLAEVSNYNECLFNVISDFVAKVINIFICAMFFC